MTVRPLSKSLDDPDTRTRWWCDECEAECSAFHDCPLANPALPHCAFRGCKGPVVFRSRVGHRRLFLCDEHWDGTEAQP